MKPAPTYQTASARPGNRFLAVVTVVSMLGLAGGCEELNARRSVQEGNRQYERGHFTEAAKLYEDALKLAPHLDTAHYNAGITYHKIFRPGVDTKENAEAAKAAASHFGKYLEMHPEDNKIIDLMTSVWVESGDYKSALAYWESELSKSPRNIEIMGFLASINRQAGDWDKSIEWYQRQVEVGTVAEKVAAHMNVGKLAVNRLLDREGIITTERLRIADTGIAELLKAAVLDPENPDIELYISNLYGHRSWAQNAAWAQAIEGASAQYHRKRWSVLTKQRKEKEAQQQQQMQKGGAEAAAGKSEG